MNPILIGMEKGIKRIKTLIEMNCNGEQALISLKNQLKNIEQELIEFKNIRL